VTEHGNEAPAFEKEVVRLPDGRELTYYRFPESPERASEAAGNRGSPSKKD
jgi:hypothetical protein